MAATSLNPFQQDRRLRERFQIAVGTPIEVEKNSRHFRVVLPLVRI